MNAEKILRVLFVIIDLIHDANIVEWIDFADNNIVYFLADLTVEEKFEVAHRLNSLHLSLGGREWHRRFNVVKKIHELI